jgi:hypothetical protein
MVAGVTARWFISDLDSRRVSAARTARSAPARSRIGASQDGDLMAEYEQLGVLRRVGMGQLHQPADDPGEDQV